MPAEIPCPVCGTHLPLAHGSITITAFPQPGSPGRVAIGCPGCARRWSVQVDDALFDELRGAGSEVAPDLGSRGRHPAGRGRGRRRVPEGPPIGWDDLLAFHELLQRDDWFDQLVTLQGS